MAEHSSQECVLGVPNARSLPAVIVIVVVVFGAVLALSEAGHPLWLTVVAAKALLGTIGLFCCKVFATGRARG
jgi:uncharacterized membrane protein